MKTAEELIRDYGLDLGIDNLTTIELVRSHRRLKYFADRIVEIFNDETSKSKIAEIYLQGSFNF